VIDFYKLNKNAKSSRPPCKSTFLSFYKQKKTRTHKPVEEESTEDVPKCKYKLSNKLSIHCPTWQDRPVSQRTLE